MNGGVSEQKTSLGHSQLNSFYTLGSGHCFPRRGSIVRMSNRIGMVGMTAFEHIPMFSGEILLSSVKRLYYTECELVQPAVRAEGRPFSDE